MKLNGNKRNGRYTQGNNNNKIPEAAGGEQPAISVPDALKKKRKKRVRIVAVSVSAALLALVIAVYGYMKLSVAPPQVKTRITTKSDASANPSGSGTTGISPSGSADRKSNQYTFVILGVSGGNTDTMMVANFNADTHHLNVVSVPRDTLVNVSWYVKKINSLYPYKGIDGVVDGLTDILGFQVDFYVLVDLEAFTELVDAVGGIDFDVPKDMNYDDPAQNLHIHLKQGLQHLDGKTAIQLVRCRSVYSNADIGRISTQQDFLKAASEQILKKQNSLNLVEMVNIFLKYVKTDLTYGNLIWFGKEFYKMDSGNIEFSTIPANYYDTVNNTSYVTINVNDWLDVVNEKLNPFKTDVTVADTSILTRNKSGALYVTNGVYAGSKSWGTGSSSSGSKSASSDSAQKASSSPGTKTGTGAKPSSSPKPSQTTDSAGAGSDTTTSAAPDETSQTPDTGETPQGNTTSGDTDSGASTQTDNGGADESTVSSPASTADEGSVPETFD